MIRRWLGSVVALVTVSAGLAGCAYAPPDTDTLEDTLETIESVDRAAAYLSIQGAVGLIISIDEDAVMSDTAVEVADAFLESEFSGYLLVLSIETRDTRFTWEGYDPEYAERYAAATELWLDLLALPGVEPSMSSGDAFVRGTEFGFRFSVADPAVVETTLAKVSQMIADAGFVFRASGVALVD